MTYESANYFWNFPFHYYARMQSQTKNFGIMLLQPIFKFRMLKDLFKNVFHIKNLAMYWTIDEARMADKDHVPQQILNPIKE